MGSIVTRPRGHEPSALATLFSSLGVAATGNLTSCENGCRALTLAMTMALLPYFLLGVGTSWHTTSWYESFVVTPLMDGRR